MSVPAQTPSKEYIANGTTTAFPLEFNCDKAEYLIVTLNGEDAPVGSWTLANDTVTFNVAPLNGVVVNLERNTPFQRTTNYQLYDNSFRPSAVNKDFDLIWWKLQELGYRDQVIWLALIKEISDRTNGDIELQNQINTIEQQVDLNTQDIAKLITDLSQEIADRIKGDQILKDMFLSMIDEAINEGTINALAVTHLDSLEALEGVTNVWDGRTIYVKDLGNYRYDALTTSWIKAHQDADNVIDRNESQKEINSITPRYFSSVDELLAYPHKRNGLIAITKSYHAGLEKGGSKYVYDSSKASINNGVTIIGGWVLLFDDRICVTQAGCKLDGITDDSIAFNNCSDLNVPMCAKVSGRLRALSPLRFNHNGFIGSGMFFQIDSVGGHDGIILPLGGGRLFQNIEKFFLMSSDNSAQNQFAIRSAEITNPATQSLGNGFKIRDIEIGGGGRFGCGIALTDCFRTSINDIGMTSCANAIVLYGRVVQCKVGVVTSNSDEFEPSSVTTTVLNKLTSLPASIDKSKRYGLLVTGSSHTGSYQYPESIKSRDNSYVKHDYGLYHYDGLFCSYKDIDLDYNLLHGAYFYSCNGIVTLETAWIAQNTGASHGIVIETSTTENKRLVIKNVFGTAYGSLTASSSIVYQSSNGTTEPYRAGLEIDGVVCGSSLFSYAVHLNRSKNFALSRVMEEQQAINYGVLLENCQDFSFKNCDLNKSKLDSITGNYELSQVSGTIDYAFMSLAKNTSSVENSLSVFNKKFGLSATAGGYAAPIQFDGGYLWIASSGKLMKKVGSVAPTSDTDGVEIT
ncbi:hypothetical protein QZK05_01970 [Acinetobacter baumannii]|nr:hypothetical protein [Acinetobacter baumannii]